MKLVDVTGVTLDWIYKGVRYGISQDVAAKLAALDAPPKPNSRRA
jgi:hypothetical protein